MERLTVKRKDGRWALANNNNSKPMEQMEKIPLAINRLAAYEETGLEPEEIMALIHPPNDPLTLEQLRKMDGMPVWVCSKKAGEGFSRYDILTGFTIFGLAQFYKAALPSELYGKTWLAYHQKPEDGA